MQHVVIVDDDSLHLRLVANIVADLRDTSAHAFTSSSEALRWCEQHDVDCFILDYRMPAPDGIELIRVLRSIARFALVPIVIVTGERAREVKRRALRAGANDFVDKPIDYQEFVARISTLLALQAARQQLELSVSALEGSVLESEARSREHADRLETLWRIVTNPSVREGELPFMILREGASAIRPGQLFHGLLLRLERGASMVEAVYRSERDALRIDGDLAVGRRAPDFGELLAGEVVRSWDDIAGDARANAYGCAPVLGLRSLIVAPFNAGAASYALVFGSFLPTARPFGSQDLAYIEILASLFATNFQQRWQAERMKFQIEHDALTGLINRVQMRLAGRIALQKDPHAAVAIIDIDHLRAVNAHYGYMIGDALLVEVAAALSRIATGEEIVARVGGGAFAVLLPGESTRARTAERLSSYQVVFDRPFSTGDRTGKEMIALAATIGIALAPEDGTAFDELLMRAEAAAINAKFTNTRVAFAGDARDRMTFPEFAEAVGLTIDNELYGHFREKATFTLGMHEAELRLSPEGEVVLILASGHANTPRVNWDRIRRQRFTLGAASVAAVAVAIRDHLSAR